MKGHYLATLDDIKLLADVAAQLDHVKNLAPPAAWYECGRLVAQAHTTLERILGADVALVYSPDPEEIQA
jgi:hypothetical protein